MIALGFSGDPSLRIQLFGDIDVVEEEKHSIRLRYPLDGGNGDVPGEAMFWHWVEGTKREVIRERLERLEQDIALARAANARFLTGIPTSRDLVQLSTDKNGTSHSDGIASSFLRMTLPYFDQATFDSIAQARRNEVAFEEYRLALKQALREIDQFSSSQEIQERLGEIQHDLLQHPLAKIDQRMEGLRHSLFPTSLILTGTLTSAAFLSGNILLGGIGIIGTAAAGVTELVRTWQARQEKHEEIQQLPGYFYWEATHPRQQRRGLHLPARTGQRKT